MLFFTSKDFGTKKCHFCFRFHSQARNSAWRSRNQVMNYIFGISISRRRGEEEEEEEDPTIMLFFISEDFVLKKCHFCFRFHFQAQNSARRSRNQVMNYIFGISISRSLSFNSLNSSLIRRAIYSHVNCVMYCRTSNCARTAWTWSSSWSTTENRLVFSLRAQFQHKSPMVKNFRQWSEND